MLLAVVAQVSNSDSGTTRFVLQVVALITGGGIVQLVVYLLRRRSEITALDKTSSAPLLTSANELIQRLETAALQATDKVNQLEVRLKNEQGAAAASLDMAHQQNRKMAIEIAQLRVEVDILNRQIDLYTRPGRNES